MEHKPEDTIDKNTELKDGIAPELEIQEGPLPEAKPEELPQTEQQVLKPKNEIFHFDFRESEVNLLLKALGELPTKETFNLVSRIFVLVGQQKQPS